MLPVHSFSLHARYLGTGTDLICAWTRFVLPLAIGYWGVIEAVYLQNLTAGYGSGPAFANALAVLGPLSEMNQMAFPVLVRRFARYGGIRYRT